MRLKAKALRKWSLIVTFCGAHSFFWGVLVNGDWRAMVAGLVTIILAFSLVESHAAYQRRREAAPQLARALDWGVKLRVWLAVYALVGIAASGLSAPLMRSPISMVLLWPYAGEILIGMGTSHLSEMLTGLHFVPARGAEAVATLSGGERFVATYLTTVLTGLAHTLILALISMLAYGVIRLRNRSPKPEQPNV